MFVCLFVCLLHFFSVTASLIVLKFYAAFVIIKHRYIKNRGLFFREKVVYSCTYTPKHRIIQWNLSTADMLYSGHLSIADTLFKKQVSLAMVKPLYFELLYS